MSTRTILAKLSAASLSLVISWSLLNALVLGFHTQSAAPLQLVTLPTVLIVGHRPAALAASDLAGTVATQVTPANRTAL